mmetsp:Transcript_28693/g.80089  ORF Transcript_28693/g.80089 Transcript_28693/m.80089 type:complete len:219 (+) Transcript_28693:305-961(+)
MASSREDALSSSVANTASAPLTTTQLFRSATSPQTISSRTRSSGFWVTPVISSRRRTFLRTAHWAKISAKMLSVTAFSTRGKISDSIKSASMVASTSYPYSIVLSTSDSMSPKTPSCVAHTKVVGAADGPKDGTVLGATEGTAEGVSVGDSVGAGVVGDVVGEDVSENEGLEVGISVGARVGDPVGEGVTSISGDSTSSSQGFSKWALTGVHTTSAEA